MHKNHVFYPISLIINLGLERCNRQRVLLSNHGRDCINKNKKIAIQIVIFYLKH
jgi:hypothetical protein